MNQLPLEIDVRSVHSLSQEEPSLCLLDCREPSEWNVVHLSGARLIPMREIPQRLAELEEFRTARVVVHCHHGGRSLQVAAWLRKQGFAQAQSMAGGIDSWSVEIDP